MKCTLCGYDKLISDFHKSKERPSGHKSQCKVCSNSRNRKSRRIKKPVVMNNTLGSWASNRMKGIKKDSVYGYSITASDIRNLYKQQNGKCTLTGDALIFRHPDQKPSIDRINIMKGYHLDNIRITTWMVNRIKNNLTENQFIELCTKVVCNLRAQ